MLPKGTISRVLDWCMTEPIYEGDRRRAFQDFFDANSKKPHLGLQDHEVFMEWFLFDYILPNRNSMFKEYLLQHETVFSSQTMDLYTSILRSQMYSLFSVLDVQLNQGLTCRDLVTEKIYQVSERASTHYLKVGDVFMTRLVVVGDHYEILSSQVRTLARQEVSAILGFLRTTKQEINLKNCRDVYQEIKHQEPRWSLLIRNKDILPTTETLQAFDVLGRSRFVRALKKMYLDQLVQAKDIDAYLYEPGGDQNLVTLLNEFFLRKHKPEQLYLMNDVVRTLQTCVNYVCRQQGAYHFNFLLAGALESKALESRQRAMDFELLLQQRQQVEKQLEEIKKKKMIIESSELYSVAGYILDWFMMEDPRLFSKVESKFLAATGVFVAHLFYSVTHNVQDLSTDYTSLVAWAGFQSEKKFFDLGHEVLSTVCHAIRDPSIFGVDIKTAPEGYDERLYVFVEMIKES